MVLFLVFHLVDRTASYLVLYGAPAVAGIATTLVNVRVGLGWAVGEEGRSVRTFNRSSINSPGLPSYATSVAESA